MAQKIDILFSIDASGNITIAVEGAKGKDCEKITKEVEEALGIVVARDHTSEFFQETEDRVTIKLSGGSEGG